MPQKLLHLGIIPDGNRRYGKKHNLTKEEAYTRGALKIKEIAKFLKEKGIKELTVYIISKDNLGRSKIEILAVRNALKKLFEKEKAFLSKNKIAIKICGNKKLLPKGILEVAEEAERITKTNNKPGAIKVNFLMGYDGRDEIIRAFRKLGGRKKISEKDLMNALDVKSPPDLIFRSGGYQRLSGFLSYQSTYSELYFSKKLWPEVTTRDIGKAIEFFYNTKRNFGK